MHIQLPRLYAILDLEALQRVLSRPAALEDVCHFAKELASGGVTLLQYRAKNLCAREALAQARELRRTLPRAVRLVINDRADLCLASGFDGVHVGQDDLSPDSARKIVGPERLVGVSTHNVEQLASALSTSADYVAIGPVFGTSSKANPDPAVGLEGVRAARELMQARKDGRPLVAIGGITGDNAREVVQAGADCVAVISGLVNAPRSSASAILAVLV
ncbi:MAG TPA: thiamine phosphate synthase [Clostridia bacterium]|nr:thiamine phosphate synthase [Clostridia bacterium]